MIKKLDSTYGYSVRDTVSRLLYTEQTDEVDVYLTGGKPKEYGTPEREAELLAKVYAKTNGPEKMKLISIATATLEHPEIGSNKVSHFILSLIWNHPNTPIEGKVSIALLRDNHIRKFGEDENKDEDDNEE